ncbi:MAG: FAD-dependent monooxygenase [Proteobacteria bacterium]|nr:FAD-dependent monooxygenase [Pseudomonadota bacterium]
MRHTHAGTVPRSNCFPGLSAARRKSQAFCSGRNKWEAQGDTAHRHSPIGGRGMNLGIADGAELARRAEGRFGCNNQ